MVTADAKLALVEFLLATDDMSSCAQHGVEWLGTTASVQRALVAAGAVDPRRLWGVAGLGISSARTGEFSLDLEDGTHPLVAVVRGTRAVHFPLGSRQPETPLESVPFYAIPLRADQVDHTESDRRSVGLLLVAMEPGELDPDLLWFAEVLGEKLSRLRARGANADRGLDRERKLLYSIINAVTDPILLTDAGGKLIIGNRHAEELFAAREEESEGRRRAVALNNMFFSSALASAAMDRTRTWGVAARELVLVNPEDGSDLLFELLSSPVRELTEGTALVSVLRNVTDLGQARRELEDNYRKLRLAEAAVRAERNRLDLIVDSVVDPIIVSDPGGDILMTNAPAEKFFTMDIAAGQDAQMRVSANAAHLSSFVSSLLLSGRDDRWRGRISLVDPGNARQVPVEAVAAKMLSDQSELTAVVTVLHDQTEAIEKEKLYGEVKRASEELEAKVRAATAELAHQNELLRRQAVALEQASTAKSQFLANISHEFRTPLNAILGYTSMLLGNMYGPMDDPQRRVLSRVDANSRHLLVLISDILDISRIEAGRMPVQISSFRIDDVVSSVTEEIEAVIARSPVPVTFELAPRTPAIRSDQQKIKQVLVNLLSNALKFTHEGSIRVTTGYDRRSGMLTVEVRDTGIGIAPEDQQRIFEDFQQVDSSTTKPYSGTGLGLSICRRFADMLGGRIAVQSELGVGSTFTLSLPSRLRPQVRRAGTAAEGEETEMATADGTPDGASEAEAFGDADVMQTTQTT